MKRRIDILLVSGHEQIHPIGVVSWFDGPAPNIDEGRWLEDISRL